MSFRYFIYFLSLQYRILIGFGVFLLRRNKSHSNLRSKKRRKTTRWRYLFIHTCKFEKRATLRSISTNYQQKDIIILCVPYLQLKSTNPPDLKPACNERNKLQSYGVQTSFRLPNLGRFTLCCSGTAFIRGGKMLVMWNLNAAVNVVKHLIFFHTCDRELLFEQPRVYKTSRIKMYTKRF